VEHEASDTVRALAEDARQRVGDCDDSRDEGEHSDWPPEASRVVSVEEVGRLVLDDEPAEEARCPCKDVVPRELCPEARVAVPAR
jgi:hypothetical protein